MQLKVFSTVVFNAFHQCSNIAPPAPPQLPPPPPPPPECRPHPSLWQVTCLFSGFYLSLETDDVTKNQLLQFAVWMHNIKSLMACCTAVQFVDDRTFLLQHRTQSCCWFQALGATVDMTSRTMGERTRRFAMYIDDGEVRVSSYPSRGLRFETIYDLFSI